MGQALGGNGFFVRNAGAGENAAGFGGGASRDLRLVEERGRVIKHARRIRQGRSMTVAFVKNGHIFVARFDGQAMW